MTVYYANVSLTGSGGDGSEGNPWHKNTLAVQLNGLLPGGSVINIQGVTRYQSGPTDIVINSSDGGGLTLQNWLSEYWGVENDLNKVISQSAGNKFYNGYISASTNLEIGDSNEFYDCYLQSQSARTLYGNSAVFKGCTILSDNGFGKNVTGSATIVDCVLKCGLDDSFDTANSSNCVYVVDTIPPGGIHTNAQLSWSAADQPNIDDPQANFAASILAVGINAPPEPGTPPYTGYNTGLWGTPRTGIGAMDFPLVEISSTYYLNAGSVTEDGLTSETGYHSLSNLLGSIDLHNGDVINFVDNGVIDDSNSGSTFFNTPAFGSLYITVGVTFQSWAGNIEKPMWNMPTELDIIGATYFHLYDLNIMGNQWGSTIVINSNYSYSIIDPLMSCVDVDIQRCLFNGVNYPLFGIGLTSAKFINNVVYRGQGVLQDGVNYLIDFPGLGLPAYTPPALLLFACVNNTFFTGFNTAITVSTSAHSPSVSNVLVYNNVIDNITDYFAWMIDPATPVFNVIYDYNDIFNSTYVNYTPPPAQYIGLHNLNADPKLTSVYSLLSTSPCIGTGISSTLSPYVPTVDILSKSRPGTYTDIGAYQVSVSLNYFSNGTVADGTNVTSFINSYSLISAIQSDYSDPYLDATSARMSFVPKATQKLWNEVVMSGNGQYQTAVEATTQVGSNFYGYIWISVNYGNTWTQKGSYRGWSFVAMSASGKYQLVTDDITLWASNDYGNTWTLKVTDFFGVVSVSSSGQYQSSAAYNSYIYVSSDYGDTWNLRASVLTWQCSAMSSSGQYQMAVEDTGGTGYIWVSSDYGITWNQKGTLLDWYIIACSNSGQYQVAQEQTANGMWVSNDYGNTWTLKESQNWNYITISGNGQYQIAPIYLSNIAYVSSDFGNTWTAVTENYWVAVFFSTTGQYQVAVCTNADPVNDFSSAVQVSNDYGVTWTTQNFTNNIGVAVSLDGSFITVAGYPDYIYIYVSTKIGKVYVYYQHSAGREQKKLIHTGSNLSAVVQWSPYALDGTWQKVKIKAFDNEGASHIIYRNIIGSGEDITHSSGSIHLNVS